MKARDLFTSPIVHLNDYQSVDVSKFLHADSATGTYVWTFVSSGSSGDWESVQRGPFRGAVRRAVNEYCRSHQTKFARLILIAMEEENHPITPVSPTVPN